MGQDAHDATPLRRLGQALSAAMLSLMLACAPASEGSRPHDTEPETAGEWIAEGWAPDAALAISDRGPRHARLRWPAAKSAPRGYEVQVDGLPSRRVAGTTTVLTGLSGTAAQVVVQPLGIHSVVDSSRCAPELASERGEPLPGDDRASTGGAARQPALCGHIPGAPRWAAAPPRIPSLVPARSSGIE